MPTTIAHDRYFQVCAALIAADCLVFGLVDPASANAIWLIAGYVLLGLTILALASALAQLTRAYGTMPYMLSRRFLRYTAVIMIALVGLQSIGQLTTKDVATLLPFVVVAYAYFGYGRKYALESP